VIDGAGREMLGVDRIEGVLGRVNCGVGRVMDGVGREMLGVGRTTGGLENEGLGLGRAMDGRDDEMLGVGREGGEDGLGVGRADGVGLDGILGPRYPLDGLRDRESSLRDDVDGP